MWQVSITHCHPRLSHWLQTVRTSNKPKTHTFIWRSGSINRRRRETVSITAQAPLQRDHSTDTAMAPTVTLPMNYSMEHLPLNIKLRKPLVEKLRRDRINNSIEQLKTLLGQEFLKQHPDSKQEKADILEMTVHFLRQKQQQQNASTCSTAANEGYSKCMQEAVNFLSQCQVQTQSQRRQLSHFLHKLPAADKSTRVQSQPSSPVRHISSKEKTPGCAVLWRPW
ncbi:hypothetical protein ACEWY4_001030 [Coilia grayii]|uniref:Transcription factor HES-5 n=1 Tax=Coilia grayii TaxID=363190 RepID=A0ABD1KYD6_9TELE